MEMAGCWNPTDWRPEFCSAVLLLQSGQLGLPKYSGSVADHRTESMRLLVLATVVLSGYSRVT